MTLDEIILNIKTDTNLKIMWFSCFRTENVVEVILGCELEEHGVVFVLPFIPFSLFLYLFHIMNTFSSPYRLVGVGVGGIRLVRRLVLHRIRIMYKN